MRHVLVLAVLLVLPLLSPACNSCQSVCVTMRSYLQSQCDMDITDEELTACIQSQTGEDVVDQLPTCAQLNSFAAIEEQFESCEQMRNYFPQGGGSSEGSGEG